jgi:hypothetical protein
MDDLLELDELRPLREAAPGERVYMRAGDVFTDADVIELRECQDARRKDGRGPWRIG